MLLFGVGMLIGVLVAGFILALVAAASEDHDQRERGDSDGEG